MIEKKSYSISTARWELSQILDRVEHHGERVTLTRHNIPVAVIVPIHGPQKVKGKEKARQDKSV